MRRLVTTVSSVLFFGVGWLAATSGLHGSGVFRLSIDAPTGARFQLEDREPQGCDRA
jgi:hypothetical protein